MRKITKAGVGAIGAATLLVGGLAGPALADASAGPSDFVAVGSDTVQNVANFLFEGDQNGDLGFNSANKLTRVFSFDANGDANGRALYALGATSNLPVTAVLRTGTLPVPRPNGSGAGIAALTADSVGGTGYVNSGYPTLPNGSINIVRASRLPKLSELQACQAITDCGGLHVFQFAYDNLQAATAVTTNAVSNLTVLQLAHIFQCDTGYTTWNGSGLGGTSTDTVIPVIPQSGSGTRNFFIADLTAALPGFALGACVQTGQEHDPSSIYSNAHAADVIMPFSTAKIALINGTEPGGKQYFGSAEAGKITTDFTGGAGYNTSRGLYFVVRDFDLTNAAPYNATATKNIFQYLFQGSTSFVAKSANAALIQAAGLSTATDPISGPAYQDLGDVTSG